MLQQTRVTAARPYFERFLRRFPTVDTLAAAPVADVLKHWEGLGYYSRARNLQTAAREIVARHSSRIPASAAALAQLPGIGPYTAAAIASICFHEPVPVVDGNVARVFSRYLGWTDDFRKLPARRKLAVWLQPHIMAVACPGDFNQAMMELGALACLPHTPLCDQCPLATACHAHCTGTQEKFPVRPAHKSVPTRHACAVVIRRRGRLLLVQRREQGLLGGFWELPGGETKRKPDARTAATAVKSQTGLIVSDLSANGMIEHVFSHFRLQLVLFAAGGSAGRLRANARARWVHAAALVHLLFSTAHRRALQLCIAATRKPRQ